jgi:aspartate/methionine/tyrosine aminotransferase
MDYKRMPIEVESPEMIGYSNIPYNLAESSVTDLKFKDLGLNLDDLVIAYTDHFGKPELRALLAAEHENIDAAEVLLTPSAATALFMIHTTLLNADSHLIVVKPNYGTNIETPKAIGCAVDYVDLKFEEGYCIDVEDVKQKIKPTTRLISITSPHNPTGTIVPEEMINALITLAEERGCYLLIDETYKFLQLSENTIPDYVSRSKQVISVCSFSKAFGLPGIRLGWLITKDAALYHQLLAAKEQIIIANSVVDEEIAFQFYKNKNTFLIATMEQVNANFETLQTFMAEHPILEWVEPSGGVVCFPRVKATIKLDTEKFYHRLLSEYATFVGAGHWFDESDRSFRLGFGYLNAQDFREALHRLDQCLSDSIIS